MRSKSARALTGGVAALAAMVLLYGVALAGEASALTHEWRCKPANDTWCFDPSGLANWHQGEVKLEKGYNAYICVGLFKEGWSGADLCSEAPLADGEDILWKWGEAYSSHDPLHGAGLQDNAYGNAQEIWNWFYTPASSSVLASGPSLLAQPSAEQLEAFPFLGEAATPADAAADSASVREALAEAEAQHGVNPAFARTVLEEPAATAVIAPGEGVICMVATVAADGTSTICEPNAQAAARGIGLHSEQGGERFLVLGVMPASADASALGAATSAGEEIAMRLSARGGYALQSSAEPAALNWASAGAQQHSRQLFWPPLPNGS